MSLRETGANGVFMVGERFELAKGADIASATTITLGTDGNFFTVAGATTINGIVTAGWQAGSQVILELPSGLTVTHNSGAPGAGAAPILFPSGANLVTTAVTLLLLAYDGTNWVGLAGGSSGGVGTVTGVSATAPLFITGGASPTPNVTIQGSITSGSTSTAPQNIGLLTTGLLKGTVAAGVNTLSTAAAGTDYQGVITWPAAAQLLVSAGTGTPPVGDANLTYNTTTHTFSMGTTTLIPDGSASAPAIAFASAANSGLMSVVGRVSVTVAGARQFDCAGGGLFYFVPTNATLDLGSGTAALTISGTSNNLVITAAQHVNFGSAALATGAAVGYVTIPSMAGTPSGTPSLILAGQIPETYDSTNRRRYSYSGAAWRLIAQDTGGLATGILKNTTGTGIHSIAAAGTDYQAPGNYITALTGDVTAAGPGSAAATLAAHGSPGTYGGTGQYIEEIVTDTPGRVSFVQARTLPPTTFVFWVDIAGAPSTSNTFISQSWIDPSGVGGTGTWNQFRLNSAFTSAAISFNVLSNSGLGTSFKATVYKNGSATGATKTIALGTTGSIAPVTATISSSSGDLFGVVYDGTLLTSAGIQMCITVDFIP